MSFWTEIRDGVESVAVVAGNYFVPGSSLLTSHLASKGSKKQLDSDIGQVAQIVSSVYGVRDIAHGGNGLFGDNGMLFNGSGGAASNIPAGFNPNSPAMAGANGISQAGNVAGNQANALWAANNPSSPWMTTNNLMMGSLGLQGAGIVAGGMAAKDARDAQKELLAKNEAERRRAMGSTGGRIVRSGYTYNGLAPVRVAVNQPVNNRGGGLINATPGVPT